MMPAALLRRHGLAADKKFSQCFLLDPSILARFAGECVSPRRKSKEQHAAAADAEKPIVVYEIGPGPAGLTTALLDTPQVAGVLACELDLRMFPLLNDVATHYAPRLSVMQGDALKAHTRVEAAQRMRSLVTETWGLRMEDVCVVGIGNLPFAVATPMLVQAAQDAGARHGLVFSNAAPDGGDRRHHTKSKSHKKKKKEMEMENEEGMGEGGAAPGMAVSPVLPFARLTWAFQREVAMRIGAAPGSKDYGRLSVLAQLMFDVQTAFDLPAGAFTPAPKVKTSVLTLHARTHLPVTLPDGRTLAPDWLHVVHGDREQNKSTSSSRPAPSTGWHLDQLCNSLFRARRKTLSHIINRHEHTAALPGLADALMHCIRDVLARDPKHTRPGELAPVEVAALAAAQARHALDAVQS